MYTHAQGERKREGERQRVYGGEETERIGTDKRGGGRGKWWGEEECNRCGGTHGNGTIHDATNLLGMHLSQRTTEHREVLAEHKHGPPVDAARARHNPIACRAPHMAWLNIW
jgi:hypothetical protein